MKVPELPTGDKRKSSGLLRWGMGSKGSKGSTETVGNAGNLGSGPWREKLRASAGVQKTRMLILGRHFNDGWIFKLAIYIILSAAALLYLNPIVYMLTTSLKQAADLVDPTIQWLPSKLEWSNYASAIIGLKYWKSLMHTAWISTAASFLQMVSCAITGYAFARMRIPGKSLLFFIVLLTFLIPPQTLSIPLHVLYSKLGWLNTPLPLLVPALFAQGLKGALFIIIFRQFFATLPKELEESARMDGAGSLKTFWRIMLPLARPALLIVFLFSFVWHWNDFYEPALYLKNGDFTLLAQSMQFLQGNLNASVATGSAMGGASFTLNESITMAAAFLIIAPPLLVYMFAQRYFVEGIERTGIVE
ncbi:carbohydrate ABC transporter permease [Paenibacillus eucommiae]|uniref:Multiple sugar transport system permease protein n=1 Tax=Paenibacillus eucommiae TaxID=1355755 RepID=A0ABS4IT24_9BACL|nr:carbohydrate ABC transporter permease [Paenibacillus eucommiae]MBP1990708.1 multiple sugar transport system permease protein [Paenibacillus eucommiae]